MLKIFLSILTLLIGSSAAFALEIDCNISSKQKASIQNLLCGENNSNKGCFAANWGMRYEKYARQNNNLRACGYSDVADEREVAMMTYANRLQPLGECIGEQADLHGIWLKKKADVASETTACTPEHRKEVEAMLPDVEKFIAALRDPEPGTLWVYRNLGIVKK